MSHDKKNAAIVILLCLLVAACAYLVAAHYDAEGQMSDAKKHYAQKVGELEAAKSRIEELESRMTLK